MQNMNQQFIKAELMSSEERQEYHLMYKNFNVLV